MRHLKRIIAFIAVLAISVACFGTVNAANGSNAPQASPTLSVYAVWLDPGDNSGELDISFTVTAAGWADSLGVAYIEIYQASNDKLVDTVYGTTDNGLVSTGFSYTHTYTYPDATPGVQYYAIVAVFAQIGTTFHSRTLRTRTVTAP